MQHDVTLPEVKAFRLVVNSFLSGYSPGLLFHRRAQGIGQKTELFLLKVLAEPLHLHFHKCFFFGRFAFEVTPVGDRWPRTGIEPLGLALEGDSE